MLKEIYLRGPEDPKYQSKLLETDSKIEAVLNKIRMILFTNRGEVLGEPDLGMNLEDYLFQFGFDEADIKNKFMAQVNQYIPEMTEFSINMSVSFETDGVQNMSYLFITINQEVQMGVVLN
jgi:phage baseplate assembly protein W